nr:MAG TPA: hypothetical protein [Caudoviricetes sp.]
MLQVSNPPPAPCRPNKISFSSFTSAATHTLN